MLEKDFTIVNQGGLHLRPSGLLSQMAMKFECDITVLFNGNQYVAKSVLNMMSAGIGSGATIRLICDGIDEQEAMNVLSKAIESGLGE